MAEVIQQHSVKRLDFFAPAIFLRAIRFRCAFSCCLKSSCETNHTDFHAKRFLHTSIALDLKQRPHNNSVAMAKTLAFWFPRSHNYIFIYVFFHYPKRMLFLLKASSWNETSLIMVTFLSAVCFEKKTLIPSSVPRTEEFNLIYSF